MLKSWLTVPNEPYIVLKPPVGFLWPRPDFVMALTTRLVLSPYSAGVAAVVISSDWMASGGSWGGNALLCWSGVGWLSIGEEVCAWAPRGWKNPVEAAATPGAGGVLKSAR